MKKKTEVTNEEVLTFAEAPTTIAPLHVSGNEDFNKLVEKVNQIINHINK